jgi:hypothetical protein
MPSIRSILESAARDGDLVRIYRNRLEPNEAAYSTGIVVGLSDRLVMLHQLSDSIRLDGYEILRVRDVTAVETDFSSKEFCLRALEMKEMRPRAPDGVDLRDIESAARSVDAHHAPFLVGREEADPGVAFIGRAREWLKSGFRMRLVTPSAEWVEDDQLFRYSAITRIVFDEEYERTLAMVAGPDEGETRGGDVRT